MPQSKKTTSPARRPGAFKEPAALKRLSKSLDAAHEALAELQSHARRDLGQGAHDVYKDVRAFVSSARRDTGKLAKALARDFEQAEKRLPQSPGASGPRPRAATTRRKSQTAAKTTTKRSTAKH